VLNQSRNTFVAVSGNFERRLGSRGSPLWSNVVSTDGAPGSEGEDEDEEDEADDEGDEGDEGDKDRAHGH